MKLQNGKLLIEIFHGHCSSLSDGAAQLTEGNELDVEKKHKLTDEQELFIRLGEFSKKLEGISQHLKQDPKTSYDLACKLQDAILESRFFRYSVNCLSGKDRTGVMCAAGALGHVKRRNPGIASAIWAKYRSRMFDFGRPALEVARECGTAALKKVEVLALKSPAFFLPDFVVGKSDVMGVARRIREFIFIGVMASGQPFARFYYFVSTYERPEFTGSNSSTIPPAA